MNKILSLYERLPNSFNVLVSIIAVFFVLLIALGARDDYRDCQKWSKSTGNSGEQCKPPLWERL